MSRVAILGADTEAGIKYPVDYSSSINQLTGYSRAYQQFTDNLESIIKKARAVKGLSTDEAVPILLSGDLLAGYVKTKDFYDSYCLFFTFLDDICLNNNCEVGLILGNHDQPYHDFKNNFPLYTEGLNTDDLYFIDREVTRLKRSKLVVCGVGDGPYRNKDRNNHYHELRNHKREELDKYLKLTCKVINNPDKIRALVFHRARKNSNKKPGLSRKNKRLINDLLNSDKLESDVLIHTGHYHLRREREKSNARSIYFTVRGTVFNIINPTYKNIIPYDLENRRILKLRV